jgi:hypothetical protein
MDRQLYGPRGLASSSDLAALAREWVEETCARQGLAVKIADPRVLADVGSLLGYAQGAPSARASARKQPRHLAQTSREVHRSSERCTRTRRRVRLQLLFRRPQGSRRAQRRGSLRLVRC